MGHVRILDVMRVISGIAKGRPLKGPPGMGTRPMTDRLKTSLFNILSQYGFDGVRVLDLYAGSGSLGIEMLSRGADWADFVEQNTSVCRIIADNLASTKLASLARVHNMPVARFLASRSRKSGIGNRKSDANAEMSDEPNAKKLTTQNSQLKTLDSPQVDTATHYDIIILDPPYADPAISTTLEAIALSPLLAQDGLVVIGHANRVKLAEEYGGGRIHRVRHRAMGDSAFSIYEVAAPER
jgi:16S rRNA G966 N2-methylase RsmD